MSKWTHFLKGYATEHYLELEIGFFLVLFNRLIFSYQQKPKLDIGNLSIWGYKKNPQTYRSFQAYINKLDILKQLFGLRLLRIDNIKHKMLYNIK